MLTRDNKIKLVTIVIGRQKRRRSAEVYQKIQKYNDKILVSGSTSKVIEGPGLSGVRSAVNGPVFRDDGSVYTLVAIVVNKQHVLRPVPALVR